MAQQPAKVSRIGYLSSGSPAVASQIEAFRKGLREQGLVLRGKVRRLPLSCW